MHLFGLGMMAGETRKDHELPRISVNISTEMERFLQEYAASEKRSLSAQASVMMEENGAFLAWRALGKGSKFWKNHVEGMNK